MAHCSEGLAEAVRGGKGNLIAPRLSPRDKRQCKLLMASQKMNRRLMRKSCLCARPGSRKSVEVSSLSARCVALDPPCS
jgi:hypothetical protein